MTHRNNGEEECHRRKPKVLPKLKRELEEKQMQEGEK